MPKALLLGESWTTHMIHQKGFDSFTTTEYVEGGVEFSAALREGGWEVDHIPAHAIEARVQASVEWYNQYDLVVISDVGANTFLLTKPVFNVSASEPNRLVALREYVAQGGGLLMVGGYLSFSGVDAKANYANSPLAEVLPVEVLTTDDREEHPQGAKPEVLAVDHVALGGVGGDWPALLGYNRTIAKDNAEVLATVNGDPLVALGSYEKGHVGVFTTDMSPHWAPPPFMEWAGYAPLWRALATWIANK